MDYSIPLKLLLAALLGGCIGVEREMRDKPAGLRTNILICVGSTLFVLVSTRLAQASGGDQTRIAAQIITGIGFLGAGAVLHSHGFVVGLTTAATIWVVAGVGMALGAGMYGAAVVATVLTLGTLYFLSFAERHFQESHQFWYEVLVSEVDPGMAVINRALAEFRLAPGDISFRKEHHNYRLSFHIIVSADRNQQILQRLS